MIPEEVRKKLLGDTLKIKSQEVKKMQTKSRYEVIADLEQQKRDLILERDSLNEELLAKEKAIKELERQKADTIVALDRKIEDAKEDKVNFEKTMDERKETIKELIKSVDDSLARFNKVFKNE